MKASIPRLAGRLLLALAVVLSAQTPWAQIVYDVFPVEPEDGWVTGPRPRLRVGVDGEGLTEMRFRIEMSRDGFRTVDYTFDQKEDANGWAFASVGFDDEGGVFFVRRPLADGEYEWRASAWNGMEWVDGDQVFSLTIDATPPEDVRDVEIRIDEETGHIVLDWRPVVVDQEGRPEYVTKYRIYRYLRPGPFHVIRPFQVGVVEDTHFEDDDEKAFASRIVFYKITAEDAAGNEPGRATIKERKEPYRLQMYRRPRERY